MPNGKLAAQTLPKSISSPPNYQGDEKIEEIIMALDYLKDEAKKSGNDDIYQLIDSTFSICLHSFCLIKRHEMENFYRENRSDKAKPIKKTLAS